MVSNCSKTEADICLAFYGLQPFITWQVERRNSLLNFLIRHLNRTAISGSPSIKLEILNFASRGDLALDEVNNNGVGVVFSACWGGDVKTFFASARTGSPGDVTSLSSFRISSFKCFIFTMFGFYGNTRSFNGYILTLASFYPNFFLSRSPLSPRSRAGFVSDFYGRSVRLAGSNL